MDAYPVDDATTQGEMNTSVSEENKTLPTENDNKFDVMMLLQCIIASVGIIANLTVVVVFLSHKQLRRKIPNRFIINQVSIFLLSQITPTIRYLYQHFHGRVNEIYSYGQNLCCISESYFIFHHQL